MTNVNVFNFGSGPVPAKRHKNPNGYIGGWVADTAYVAETVFVGKNAEVFGNARVLAGAMVYDNARVYDNAWVLDNTRVFGNAELTDKMISVTRSDGYIFLLAKDHKTKEPVIIAGCRYFNFDEAKKHWGSKTYRDKKLGKESLSIIEHFKNMKYKVLTKT